MLFACGRYLFRDDLLSHALSHAVQSALRGLTSVFGMGTGVAPAVKSPASLTWAPVEPLGPKRGSPTGPVTSSLKELWRLAWAKSRSLVGLKPSSR